MMQCLNLGCGQRFNSTWVNIDYNATGEGVLSFNLNQRIPFGDNQFDIVYHSHLLEHFSKKNAPFFLKECIRVLKPKGVLRVVVPDLEQIVRTYLLALEKANQGSLEWASNYEWILLEMYDQVVREYSGGGMVSYLSQAEISNLEFVFQRCGLEAKNIIESVRKQQAIYTGPQLANYPSLILQKTLRLIRYPKLLREILIKLLLGEEYKALQVGRFRQSGEVHQWMYDCYSLSVLLEKAGFVDIVQRTATESYIPNWSSYNLDTNSDGTIYKPDSLFMEAIKPTT
jgi:predicted SAM-dependent methyltransferase